MICGPAGRFNYFRALYIFEVGIHIVFVHTQNAKTIVLLVSGHQKPSQALCFGMFSANRSHALCFGGFEQMRAFLRKTNGTSMFISMMRMIFIFGFAKKYSL